LLQDQKNFTAFYGKRVVICRTVPACFFASPSRIIAVFVSKKVRGVAPVQWESKQTDSIIIYGSPQKVKALCPKKKKRKYIN
jgi:hypothetical protein